MNSSKYHATLKRAGGVWRMLPRQERWSALQDWRSVYAAGLHRATGRWKINELEWHVFSFRHAHALHGERALAEYLDQRTPDLYVVPEDEQLEAGQLSGGGLPDFTGLGMDIYVWPEGLEWTMAFTHEREAGLGPYFSRREWMNPQ